MNMVKRVRKVRRNKNLTKQLTMLGVLLVTIFSLAACDDGLERYKTDAKDMLDLYVIGVGEANYTALEWAEIAELVATGRVAVDRAKSKMAVDGAVATTKGAINGVSETENEMKEILKHFDLTDTKYGWVGSVEENFADNGVLAYLRKTSAYPELELRHFRLENAKSIAHISTHPPDIFFTSGYEEFLENFRQIVCIELEEPGKEKVIEAIVRLDKLRFVKRVSPNYIFEVDD